MSEYEPAITVTYLGRDQLRIQTRGHVLFADQPIGDGGDDTAPTPTELFLAGLSACVAYYAERFLRRHGLGGVGLTIGCEYEWAENPHRVGQIALTVDAPGLSPELTAAFTRVVEHCSVHNTIAHPPTINLKVRSRSVAAA